MDLNAARMLSGYRTVGGLRNVNETDCASLVRSAVPHEMSQQSRTDSEIFTDCIGWHFVGYIGHRKMNTKLQNGLEPNVVFFIELEADD